MGVASNKIKGKAEFVNFSFDVSRARTSPAPSTSMLHNDKNTPPSPVMQGPVIGMAQDKEVCYICDKSMD